jgi:hypothetical protein
MSTHHGLTPARRSTAAGTVARLAWCAGALCMLPLPAHAYLDPGSGSLIFQSLLALLFGIGVAFRQLRAWVARAWAWLLRRPLPPKPGDGREDGPGGDPE